MFWAILVGFSCRVQNGGNNGGNMMYNYGLDHKELSEIFLVLTAYMVQYLNIKSPNQNIL